MDTKFARSMMLGSIAAVGFVHASSAAAQTRTFDVPRQPASTGIAEFARQAQIQIFVSQKDADGKRSNQVKGEYSVEAALRRLLEGTGLTARKTGNETFTVLRSNPVAAPSQVDEREAADHSDSLIVVTGTNIRGIAPESSPARVYTRDDIARSGAATAQEFISKLPENFNGGSNPGVPGGLANDTSAGANSGGFGSYGASVNLRGLGSGSTLVLLNGSRVAPSSIIGDFVDISMIPATAIERVETLTDGASSIYGSDAVAGVVNFILRDKFDGLEASFRYGVGTEEGAPDQVRASLTGGKTWTTGSILGVFEHFNQDELLVEDRDFAIQDFSPSYLLPSQSRNSLLGVLNQDIGDDGGVSITGLYSERESNQFRTDFTGNTFEYDAESEVFSISGHAFASLGPDWFFDLFGQYGTVDTNNFTSGNLLSSGPYDQLRYSQSQVWSSDARLSGPVISLPAGNVKIALGGHYRNEKIETSGVTLTPIAQIADRDVYAAYGEAFVPLVSPENDIPGIARLELNLSARFSDYSDFGSTFDPKAGVLFSPLDGLNLRGSYSTSFKAPALGLVGAQDFGASLLPTSLFFSIFQLTPADPSLADVVQLTIAGTDNDLEPETSRAFTLGFDYSRDWENSSFTVRGTWFDINFKNRLGNIPIPGNVIHFDAINLAFDDPSVFPEGSFTFDPSAEEIDDVLGSLETPLGNPFGLDPYDTFFISRLLVVTNTSRSIVRGFDLGAEYTRELDSGSVRIALDGTYLRDFKRQAVSSTPVVQNLNTVFNPVDLKMRGTVGYTGSNLSGAVFINYIDSYKTDNTPKAAPIDSWTTVDLNVTFDTKDNLGGAFFRDTALRLSITNLFDQDPPKLPLFADISVDGYDPTNASPLGRFISLELTKRF